MGLESATYINDLNTSNPTGSDLRSEGDDHLRLIKKTLKNTFPNITTSLPISESAAKATRFYRTKQFYMGQN